MTVCSSTATTWFHATDQPPAELVHDCNILLAAKDTLRGTGTLNWSTDTPITTPWNGISFHSDIKWIRKIELQLLSLNGTIPPVLGHLSSPGSLDLVLGGDYRKTDPVLENKLTGPIPPELGLPPNLVVLALSFNNLSGPIPRELANNGKLRFLYLHDTDKPAWDATGPEPPGVSGHIPAEFGDLPLRGLSISSNRRVTGHIPWQLGKNVSSDDHPGLQVLNLYDNSLEGNIPWQLGNLGKDEATIERRTVWLFLNGNRLTGSLPPELGGIANLTVLSLSDNRLTGSLPPELGNLSKLQYLSLSDNRLSGSVPPELGNLGALRELFLYNNQLRGQIPAELGQLTELQIMALHRNQLGGAIPAQIGNLAKLTGLHLDWNRLDGAIPSELGQLSQLRVLSLSCNGLSGPVPAGIGEITTLTELNLQGNPALQISERPNNLQRSGLTVKWTGQCEQAFADVLPGVTYESAVSWMIHQGTTRGCSPTMFCPDRNVTRQQFVTFLWRAADRPVPDYLGSDAFADIEEDVYSDRAIGWAVSEGVTVGCTPGSMGEESWKFRPEQSVTRGQMAALLYQYAETEYTSASSSYTDVEPDGFYTDGIAWLTDFEVVSGCGPGLYCPNRDATRAEAALFIHGVATRPHIWGPGSTPFNPPSQ